VADNIYLQTLVNTEQPARMVGILTPRAMRPHELERLVGACVAAMRQEDQGASLTVTPLGNPSPAELELQRTWRVTVRESTDSEPHDCLVQIFALDDPSSTHHALVNHLSAMDGELGKQAREAEQNSQTFLTVASGKLDDQNRVHPFQNLVALFSTALGAWILDPAAALVTQDPGEWADSMEMSLSLEKDLGLLRR
jgi:hypothetical protein